LKNDTATPSNGYSVETKIVVILAAALGAMSPETLAGQLLRKLAKEGKA
jgi:hypothetical protein